jgi:tetratricopeptide (TPR) repeat protein
MGFYRSGGVAMQGRSIFRLGAILSLCCFHSVCFGEGWIGVKVLPVDIDAPIVMGDRTIGTVGDFDFPRTIEQEKGDWVLLKDTKLEGWVQKTAVESIESALRRTTEAVRRHPTGYSQGSRGNAWFCKGEYDSAIKDYSEAIRLETDETNLGTWYEDRGETWLRKGDAEQAVRDLTQALRHLVKTPAGQYETYRQRAMAYDTLGDKEAAEADRREVERIKQKLPK